MVIHDQCEPCFGNEWVHGGGPKEPEENVPTRGGRSHFCAAQLVPRSKAVAQPGHPEHDEVREDEAWERKTVPSLLHGE